MLQPPSFVCRYVGLPFKDGGRCIEDGLDCFGLVRIVLQERCGITLPEYAVSESDHLAVESEIIAAQASGDWLPVLPNQQRQFDVAEMIIPVKISGIWEFPPLHVGIVIGNEWILHAERATHSRLSPIHDRRVNCRILGYWRHRKLAG